MNDKQDRIVNMSRIAHNGNFSLTTNIVPLWKHAPEKMSFENMQGMRTDLRVNHGATSCQRVGSAPGWSRKNEAVSLYCRHEDVIAVAFQVCEKG